METTQIFYTSVREICPSEDYNVLAMIIRNASPVLFLYKTNGWIQPSEYYDLMSGKYILNRSNEAFFKSLRMVWQIQRMFSTKEELSKGLIPSRFRLCLQKLIGNHKYEDRRYEILKILEILDLSLPSFFQNNSTHLALFKIALNDGEDLGVLYEKLWNGICEFNDWFDSSIALQSYLAERGAVKLYCSDKYELVFFRRKNQREKIISFVRDERDEDLLLILFDVSKTRQNGESIPPRTIAFFQLNSIGQIQDAINRLSEFGIDDPELIDRIKNVS